MHRILLTVAALVFILGFAVAGASAPDAEALPRRCTLPKDRGHCRDPDDDHKVFKFWYNMREGKCEKFAFYGCGGNGNRFKKLKGCQRACKKGPSAPAGGGLPHRCTLPKDRGHCRDPRDEDKVYKFLYNMREEKCERFAFYGCGGNKNRFDKLKGCQQTCEKGKPPSDAPPQEPWNVCQLPRDRGHCRDPRDDRERTRYYFNTDSENCEWFKFFGCGGNANNFHTLKECQQRCERW
ncbi:actinia tenebrosa protease inhibitors-like isoform X2 [Ornithodoros turicata]|uniref:actinia tenebrosa protease inhibitors-like isoform X2 n=1 Tax=Ornithodoros turicata TaxID=34597 RepID=UPI0031389085